MKEITTEGKGPAVWTEKEHLVLNSPQWGVEGLWLMGAGVGAGALLAKADHKFLYPFLSIFKQLFDQEIYTLLYKPRFSFSKLDSKRQWHDFYCLCCSLPPHCLPLG